MRLILRLDGRALRRFHLELAQALAVHGDVRVKIEDEGAGAPMPRAAASYFAFEALIFGLAAQPRSAPVERAVFAAFAPAPAGPDDLVIDLAGRGPAAHGKTWRLSFDGASGDGALLASLARGRAPLAALTESGRIIAAGRLGTESNGILSASFEDALARVTTLLVAAVGGSPSGAELRGETAAPMPTNARLALRGAKSRARQIARRAYSLAYETPHWRVGWRRLAGPDVIDLKRHPDSGWTDLPDDSRRFYADPFPILHGGRVTLFVEDFVHRLGRGVISAVEFGADGPLGRPEPVLELPVHLSYPFVFARDGEVWMIPESCAAGTIDLYRATRFPGGWVKEATLVSGVTASDATLLELEGRWWLFATVKAGGGSFSDALFLWSALDFRGPWTAHKRNPVLIDIASARPAGRITARGCALWRPVQDCRGGYGHALALARITRLDDEGYSQRVETVLTAGPLWPGRRLHTLNAAGGFEFIDGSGTARRF